MNSSLFHFSSLSLGSYYSICSHCSPCPSSSPSFSPLIQLSFVLPPLLSSPLFQGNDHNWCRDTQTWTAAAAIRHMLTEAFFKDGRRSCPPCTHVSVPCEGQDSSSCCAAAEDTHIVQSPKTASGSQLCENTDDR